MLRFELRVIDDDGDGEMLVSDYTTIDPAHIDQFGGCETVDMHVAAALRFVRRNAQRAESKSELAAAGTND